MLLIPPHALQIATATLVIAVVANAGGAVARRVRQPAVVGEMVAGIAIGPSVLGALFPRAEGTIFASAVRPQIASLAQVGIAIFMFTVGASFGASTLEGRGRVMTTTALAGIIVPLCLGVAGAAVVYRSFGATSTSFVAFACFLAVASTVTAFPVLARILDEAGLRATSLGSLSLACAGIADAVAWCLLIAVIAGASASGALDALRALGLLSLWSLALLAVVRPIVMRLFTADTRPAMGIGLLFITALLALSARLTASLGMHVIAGAFVAGLAVRGHPILRAASFRTVERASRLLLLPVFFAVIGLQIDVANDGIGTAVLLGSLVMLVFGLAGKLGATSLAARAGGLTWRQSLALGLLMNTKGLTELVVIQIGLQIGVLNQAGFTALVGVTLLTTAVAMPGLSALGLLARRPSLTRSGYEDRPKPALKSA